MASLRERKKSRVTRIGWRLSYCAYRIFDFVLRFVPLRLIFRVGQGLGWVFYKLSPRYRSIVRRNLRIVSYRDGLSLEEIEQLTRRNMMLAVANILSSVKTATLSRDALLRCLELEEETFPEISANGSVTLVAHMGNWEVLAQIAAFSPGKKLGSHYRPLNNPYIDAFVKRRRERTGTRLFSKRDSPLELVKFIRRGGQLGILADQKVGAVGIQSSYFGRTTTISPLPTLLARRADRPVIAVALSTVGCARWKFEAIVPDAPVTEAQDTARLLETAIKRSIVDGFWLHQRFKLSKVIPLSQIGKAPTQPLDEIRTPTRVLIWQTDEAEVEVPDLVDDLRCEYLRPSNAELCDHTTLPAAATHVLEAGSDPFDEILRLDREHPLPFEVIATAQPNERVRHAAKKLHVPFYHLPSRDHPAENS